MTCWGQKRVDAQSQPARAIRPAMLGAPAASIPPDRRRRWTAPQQKPPRRPMTTSPATMLLRYRAGATIVVAGEALPPFDC